jgi:hypothetical protein
MPEFSSAIEIDEYSPVVFERWPQTDDELWEFVATIWGIEIPRVRICPQHCSPFEAFAEAYFCRAENVLWLASRGLAGKSFMLATLGLTEAVCLGATTTILGGSGAQSQNVHRYMQDLWSYPAAPRKLLSVDPTKMRTVLSNGASIQALLASSTSVRGPHPTKLLLDEVDEMDLTILDAALGQPMAKGDVAAQTVLSSTHHYPNGTVTELLKRAKDKGWPVRSWCFRESMAGGWLKAKDVEAARERVPAAMWEVEYELQEPNPEGRAIQPQAVEWTFDPSMGVFAGNEGEKVIVEAPQPEGKYITGADWAKELNWTVIVTYRVDCIPWRMVAFERLGRRPWPVMVKHFDDRVRRYPGKSVHDATGLGDVVDDLISEVASGEVLSGRNRMEIFSEYIAALENRDIICPRIDFMYTEHKYTSVDDLFGSGHPPDSFVAGALAWRGRKLLGKSKASVRSIVTHPRWMARREKESLRAVEPWAYD